MRSHSDHSIDWEELEDQQLWQLFRDGNQKPLSELFMRYYAELYRYGMKLIMDEAEVKDGIQHLFLKLWQKRGAIDEADSVELYLLLSLRRILLRQKKQTSAMHRRNREYSEIEPSVQTNIEERIIQSEFQEEKYAQYQKALKTLTDRQKEVLFLRLQYGLKNKEIAEVMNLSHQRIRNYIYEVVTRLKEYIFDYSDTDYS